MSLYNKYRPTELDEIVGNEGIVESLELLVEKDSIDRPHAILLAGPSGCGKTSIARIMAKKFGVNDFDLIEVDSADFRGIDTIRDIRNKMQLKPLSGKARAWILDEAHQISRPDGQTALLKGLEDTPNHVYFFLCTTHPEKLLPTIRNRCTRFEVNSLKEKELKFLIKSVLGAERKSVTKGVLDTIIETSKGSARSALVYLEKVIDIEDEAMALEALSASEEFKAQTIYLCRALINKAKWDEIIKILNGITEEQETVRMAVLGYCQAILLKKKDPNAYYVMTCFAENYYSLNVGKVGLVMSCWDARERT